MYKLDEPVSLIMTKSPVTADVNDHLRHVNTLMKKHNVRHLPVVSGKKLVGIVSKSDILRLSFGDMFEDNGQVDETIFDMLRLDQVMMNNPATVKTTDSIKDVARILSKVEFHALPVLRDDEIVGIVSTTDLIRFILESSY